MKRLLVIAALLSGCATAPTPQEQTFTPEAQKWCAADHGGTAGFGEGRGSL